MIFVSENLIKIAKEFGTAAPLYITGGYVRNLLMGLPAYDIDLCSRLGAEEAEKIFVKCGCTVKARYGRLGTLKLICKDESYEYTTFRKDTYQKGHTPVKVEFCDNVCEDALRRDFTVNSIYYDILNKKIYDPLKGTEDIKNKTIRAFEPFKVFSADGLRLLRMVRFACELNFEIEKQTFSAAYKYNELLKDIAAERIYEEFYKILNSDGKYPAITEGSYPHYSGIKMLKEAGLLPHILPLIELSYGILQRKDFHKYDVFEHTAQTVKHSHSSIRIAAALHDIGKGICFKEQGNFYGHEIVGAQHAAKILGQNGLKCSGEIIDETVFLIRYHMYDLNCKTGENKIKLFIANNHKYFQKLLLLKQADYLGCGLKSGIAPTAARWLEIEKQMKDSNTPFSLKELEIDGLDVIREGCPEKHVSKVLNNILKDCIINPELNRNSVLIGKAQRLIGRLLRGLNI